MLKPKEIFVGAKFRTISSGKEYKITAVGQDGFLAVSKNVEYSFKKGKTLSFESLLPKVTLCRAIYIDKKKRGFQTTDWHRGEEGVPVPKGMKVIHMETMEIPEWE